MIIISIQPFTKLMTYMQVQHDIVAANHMFNGHEHGHVNKEAILYMRVI